MLEFRGAGVKVESCWMIWPVLGVASCGCHFGRFLADTVSNAIKRFRYLRQCSCDRLAPGAGGAMFVKVTSEHPVSHAAFLSRLMEFPSSLTSITTDLFETMQ